MIAKLMISWYEMMLAIVNEEKYRNGSEKSSGKRG